MDHPRSAHIRSAHIRFAPLPALLAIVGLLALAACSAPILSSAGPTGPATPTPDAGAILQRAIAADYRDASYTLTFSGSALGQSVAGSGAGRATKSPSRTDTTVSGSVDLSGTKGPFTAKTITDVATNALYTSVTGLGYNGKWTKSALSGSASKAPIDLRAFTSLDAYKNAKLIGAETLDGVAVWHVQASQSTSNGPVTADIYIRQNNGYPAKITGHLGGLISADATVKFTAFNSGVSVALPRV